MSVAADRPWVGAKLLTSPLRSPWHLGSGSAQDKNDILLSLGYEPPLIADGRSVEPDRREVSARWLSGTFLTGVTSSVLMGVALFTALDGRQQLATPPEIVELASHESAGDSGEVGKTIRLVGARQIEKAKARRRMEVSMVTKVGTTNRAYPRSVASQMVDVAQVGLPRSG